MIPRPRPVRPIGTLRISPSCADCRWSAGAAIAELVRSWPEPLGRAALARRDLEKLLVENSNVLACVPRERLLQVPSALLVEAERKVSTDPSVGDPMFSSPVLQVLHQRPPYTFAPPIPADDHAGHPGTGIVPLVKVVRVQTNRSQNFAGDVMCDKRHRELLLARLIDCGLEPPSRVIRLRRVPPFLPPHLGHRLRRGMGVRKQGDRERLSARLTTAYQAESTSGRFREHGCRGAWLSVDTMLDMVGRIAAAVELPVTADLEAGYGERRRGASGSHLPQGVALKGLSQP